MSQTICARLNGVVYATVKDLAGKSQPFQTDVSATYAPVQQGGNITLEHHWLVTVSIPNPIELVSGEKSPDLAASFPIYGVVPPPFIFEDVAKQLFDKCMEAKATVLKPPEPKASVTNIQDAPRKKRERERELVSHFPSKDGSGDFTA